MKKTKRILAMLGAILLLGLYLCTFIFALIKSPLSMQLFRASIFCTIVVPVILYMYMMVYRRVKGGKEPGAGTAAAGERELKDRETELQDGETDGEKQQDPKPDEGKRQAVKTEEETQEVTDE